MAEINVNWELIYYRVRKILSIHFEINDLDFNMSLIFENKLTITILVSI